MTLQVDTQVSKGSFALRAAFEAPPRGFTAVSGPSGCGKTTLLRTIAGLEPGAGGRISLDGDCWLGPGCRVPTHRRGVAYVFQQATLLPHLDVCANLMFAERHGRHNDGTLAFDDVVSLLGLSQLLQREPGGLSGGERQRVAIAQALLSSPRLLLMDEPMASLDRASRQTLLPYLEALQGALDIPVLYVTHALDEVARLADHMLLIQAGEVRASGPVNLLLTRLDLPMAFGREAGAVIPAEVAGHDDDDALTRLTFSGGELWAARVDVAPGTRVRLRILSRDLSLSLQPLVDSSILSGFGVQVEGVAELGASDAMVQLRAGHDRLLSRVPRRALHALNIEPGRQLYAQVRSVAALV